MNLLLRARLQAAKRCTLVAALLVASLSALAQTPRYPVPGLPYWQWQSPRPTGYTLQAVHVFDDTMTVVGGYGGTLLKTTDRGQSWTALDSGAPYDIKGLSFVSPQVGWLANNTPNTSTTNLAGLSGPGQVRKTVDGGLTWTVQPIGEPDFVEMQSIHFFSPTQGYVTYVINEPGNNRPQVRATTDGGQTWTLVRFAGRAVQFVTPLVGFRVGNGFVSKTINGGQSSTIITPLQGVDYSKLFFTDELNGWVGSAVSGSIPTLFHTTDGGATWTTVNLSGLPNFYVGVSTISFADAQHGVVDNRVTTDGGQTWALRSGQLPLTSAMQLRPGGAGVAVGSDGTITTTTDYGLTNQRRDVRVQNPQGGVPDFTVVHFPEPAHGWALHGSEPNLINPLYGVTTVYRTVDAGVSWQAQDLQPRAAGVSLNWNTSRLSAGAFPDRDTAYVAGAQDIYTPTPIAFVLRTVNAGQSWTQQPLPTIAVLHDLQFSDGRSGAAVGEQGTILYTRDAGATWLRASSGTTARLRKVCWAAPQVAYALGAPATFLKTTDGGATWQPVPTTAFAGVTDSNVNLAFTSATTGFTCLGGRVYRTTDGGLTWLPASADVRGTLVGSAFAPTGQGWAFGTKLVRTTDGGQTWAAPFALNVTALAGHFIDAYNGWVVGANGTVLRYSEKFIQADTAATQRLSYCAGETLDLTFTTEGSLSQLPADYRVQVSNRLGRFRKGETLTLAPTTASSARQLQAVLPASLAAGTRYRLRIIAADSTVLGGDNGHDLTVNALATASISPAPATQSLCQGNSLVLTASPSLVQYAWSTGATTRSITVSTAGTYTVRGASAAGCLGPASAPVTVAIVPLPAPPVVQQLAGGQLSVQAPVAGATYQWLLGGTAIPGATQPTYPASGAAPVGTYTVVTTVNGCASAASAAVAVVLASRPQQLAGLTLYPNPARTTLYLERPAGAAAATVQLLDVTGRIVWQGTTGAGTFALPVQLVPAGLYLVRLQTPTAPTQVIRVVVEH